MFPYHVLPQQHLSRADIAGIRALHAQLEGDHTFSTLAAPMALSRAVRRATQQSPNLTPVSYRSAMANLELDGPALLRQYGGGNCISLADSMQQALAKRFGLEAFVVGSSETKLRGRRPGPGPQGHAGDRSQPQGGAQRARRRPSGCQPGMAPRPRRSTARRPLTGNATSARSGAACAPPAPPAPPSRSLRRCWRAWARRRRSCQPSGEGPCINLHFVAAKMPQTGAAATHPTLCSMRRAVDRAKSARYNPFVHANRAEPI